MRIRWYRSLRLKMFVFVALFLSVAVGYVSWQDSRLLNGVLVRQAEENLISATQKTSNSLHASLLFWAATMHATMHMGERGGIPIEDVAASLLDSSKEVVAFQVLRFRSGVLASEASRFTGNSSAPDFRDVSPARAEKILADVGREYARKAEASGDKSSSIDNLSEATGFPVLQMRIRFQYQGKSNEGVWAVLSFWPTSLSQLLHKGQNTVSLVLDATGKTLLDADGGVGGDVFFPVGPSDVASLVKDKLSFRSWNGTSKNGEPVFSVLNRIPEFRLAVLFQKIFTGEQQQVMRQTRQLLMSSWLLLLLAMLASFIATNHVSDRIRTLVASVVRIAKGDFSLQIPVVNKDELGYLSVAVNKMSADIRKLLDVRATAVRQEQELRTAEAVQRTLFPKQAPTESEVRTYSYFRPATECAGDWWGHFDLGDGRQLVVIADAVGHGASSALIAAVAFSYFATFQENPVAAQALGYSPQRMLQQLNEIFWRAGAGTLTMTMVIKVFDFSNGIVRYASAGHVPSYLVRRADVENEGESTNRERPQYRVRSLVSAGALLGFGEDPTFDEEEMKVQAGDRFLMYTDGLFECRNSHGKTIVKRELREFLMKKAPFSPNGFLLALSERVSAFFGQATLDDDVTMVLVEISEQWRLGRT